MRRPWIAVAAALGLSATAATGAAPAPAMPPTQVAAVALGRLPIHPEEPDVSQLCLDKPGGPRWYDVVQAGVYRSICLSAAKFDGFFGNARFDDEYQATYATVALGGRWDERSQWKPSLRFRLNVRLPQLSERFNVFLGRVDPDEHVTELREDFDTLPRQFAREDDDAVLLGLGYSQPGRSGGYFSTGAGARLDWPMNAYVKGTWRYGLVFFERNLLRLHETVFWREDERFGATTRTDLERVLSEDFLVRWTGSGTLTQESEGARWLSSVTLYQNLGDGRAFAWEVGASGATARDVPMADFGLLAIYRRRIHLEWLVLELRSSLTWPRDTVAEGREPNWGAGAAVEAMFGERGGR